jgi:hypothetical protein
VNISAILADADLRRKMMVSTIQATQAREGIETTPEQADRAYYVITEAEKAAFFSLSQCGASKGKNDTRELEFSKALRNENEQVRFDIARRDFSAIETSPLAYRRIGLVAHVFREGVPLEPEWGIARQGKATAGDAKWLREWWEIKKKEGWVPFAKGGDFCRFYYDSDLLLDWNEEHRDDLKASGNGLPSAEHYFKPGLTWPRRTQRGFNLRVLPAGCVFADKGPVILPARDADAAFILGIGNSSLAEYILQGLTSFGSWEVGAVKRLPIPHPSSETKDGIARQAAAIHDAKAAWDQGNEISTQFHRPWLVGHRCEGTAALRSASLPGLLDQLASLEAAEDLRIQQSYAELNDEVFRLYGIPDSARKTIEETLGERPPELVWPQMEGWSVEQKRLEHVWRLLSFCVKRVVEADDDGIVPFAWSSTEPSLIDRVRQELAKLFSGLDPNQLEVDLSNELKRKVKGYRTCKGLEDWLENAFFEYHCELYKRRPVFWHIASAQGTNPFAFGVLAHYHRFDKNRMAKLRASYLRDAIEAFRREAGIADKESRPSDRAEWLSRMEETQALDKRLQQIQEGFQQGPEGGPQDYRILTPWKVPPANTKGWDPDLDDGVKVNIAPLEKAGVLRKGKVT